MCQGRLRQERRCEVMSMEEGEMRGCDVFGKTESRGRDVMCYISSGSSECDVTSRALVRPC